MQIILVRHCETLENADEGLSNQGQKNAKKLAKFLTTLPIDKVYSSDLKRAHQTCEEYTKLKPQTHIVITDSLREIYRAIIGGPPREGTDPKRETSDKERADKFLNQLIQTTDNNILLFTHGNIIRYYLAKALKTKPEEAWSQLTIQPGSISIIEFNNNVFKVKQINSADYSQIKYNAKL